MTTPKHQTAQFMADGKWYFYRPQNADITNNLKSAFVPVNPIVGSGLIAGQHYMGGIAYESCTTEWFFSGMGAEMAEVVGADVVAALHNWFNDGIKANTVFEEVKFIVITTAQKLGWEIDLSMAYSLVQTYVFSWVDEQSIREAEDDQEAGEDVLVIPVYKFFIGQPVAIGDGFAAYCGTAGVEGRAILMMEDGSLFSADLSKVRPLREYGKSTDWLHYADTYHYKAWNEPGAVSAFARLHSVARQARLAINRNWVRIVETK